MQNKIVKLFGTSMWCFSLTRTATPVVSHRPPLSFLHRHLGTTSIPVFSRQSKPAQSKRAPKLYKRKKNPNNVFRADRVLSNRGWGSRSECFEVLQQRRVRIQVESKETRLVLGPKEKIPRNATLWVDREEVPPPPPILSVFHKPKWVLSTMGDRHKGRPNLGDLDLPDPDSHPVGRLDYDTSGLLLFSNDGRLTQRLLHPNHHIEKEYLATVVGTVQHDTLKEQLHNGIETAMGRFTGTLISVEPVASNEVAPLLKDILSNLPPEYNVTDLKERGYMDDLLTATELSQVRLVVSEGKHRMVRRMLANAGHPVIALRRERLGIIALGDLPPGHFRSVTNEEDAWAHQVLQQSKKSTSTSKKSTKSKQSKS